MTDLAKRLYDKCGGNIYKKSEAVTATAWGSKETVATAPADGILYITSIYVQPSAAGVGTTMGIDAEGDEFPYLTQTLVVVSPIHINMESAPMVIENGKSLYAIVSSGASYITVRGYYK